MSQNNPKKCRSLSLWTVSDNIEVSNNSNLSEIKEKILNCFWNSFLSKMKSSIGIHGTAEEITLKDGDIIIETEIILKDRLKESKVFQAMFITHKPHQQPQLDKV